MIAGFATAISIFALFIILHKYFPFNPSGSDLQKSPEELAKLYSSFEAKMMVFIFFFMFFSGFVITIILILISKLRFSLLPNAPFTVTPDFAYWGIIGFFLGIASTATAPVGNKITDLLLKENAEEYRAFYNSKFSLDAWFFLDFISKGLIALVTPFIFLGLGWYSQFNQNDIKINKFWAFGSEKFKISKKSYLSIPNHSTRLA